MGYYRRIKSFFNLAFRAGKLNSGTLRKALLSYLDFTVAQGPFKGMKYISQSSGSVLIPKITGTYECELHGIINTIKNNRYDALIDIGCAEGYYAIGFAMLNKHDPSFKIYAYDTDEEALKNLNALAVLNGVENKINIRNWFDVSELAILNVRNGLIICDIEGGEKELLDPEKNQALLNFDMLVEVHDGINNTAIKDILYNRFNKTHKIQKIEYKNQHSIRINYMPWIKNRTFVESVMNEGRKYGLDWLYMKKHES